MHLIEGNVAALVDDAVDLDFLPDDIDRAALVPILGRVFDGARLAAKSMDGAPAEAAEGVCGRQLRPEQHLLRAVARPRLLALGDARAHRPRGQHALAGDPSFDIFKAAYSAGLRRARPFGVEGLARIAAAAGRARCSEGARRRATPRPIARLTAAV